MPCRDLAGMATGFPSSRAVVLLGVLVEGGLALVALGLGWLLGRPIWQPLRWDTRDALLGVAASLPMLAAFFACVRWPVGPLARIRQIADDLIRPLFAACTLLDIVLICVLAGLGEELLFRGLIQGYTVEWLGRDAGILLASVLFGLLHPMTVGYVVLASLLGVYLGYAYQWTGSLLVVVIAHALYDFVALLYLVRRPAMH